MTFSVQLSADCTSAPAPRTVLHAEIASALPIRNNAVTLRTMVYSLFSGATMASGIRLVQHGAGSAIAAVNSVFSAVGSRLNILTGAADRVARGNCQRATDQQQCRYLANHG